MQSEIGNFGRLQLKLQFVRDQGDEFGIGGFAFRVADGIAEKSLECIQVASVPGHFDGVTNSTLHSGRGGLECFGDLWIQYLGDGIDHIHIVDGNDDGFPQILVSLDVGGDTKGFITLFMALMLSCLLSCFYYTKNRKPAQVPMVAALIFCSSFSENKSFQSRSLARGYGGYLSIVGGLQVRSAAEQL